MFKKLLVSFIVICLLAGQFKAMTSIAYAFTENKVPAYSIYTVDPHAKLLGLKAGKYGFSMDNSSHKSSTTKSVDSKPEQNAVDTKRKNAITNKRPTISSTPTLVPQNDISSVTSVTPTVATSTNQNKSTSHSDAPTADASQNLLPNFSFEQVEGGIAAKWKYSNNADAFLDTSSQGNNGSNSIHIKPKTNTTVYLFSDIVPVEYNTTYIWQTYLNMKEGYMGFYIDEYNANGDWISGQQKAFLSPTFNGFKVLSYTPTSSDVKSIQVQYSTYGDSNDIYIDSVIFSK